mmetsp:Transcript_30555/g.87663  ORF Transcript_30555/g.87663 Transcript_30555/m.87663 type:complete len:1037 (-) Transcript_30555:109-3219(-)
MGGANVEEADITDDVPSGARRLNVWLRRTRQNKVRKVVREVYLRDDIVPEIFEGADQIVVLDTNIALHQIDFIAEDTCVNHVIVPYTVLQEVRHRHMGTYARLRALCRVDVHADAGDDERAAAELEGESMPIVRGRGTALDTGSARNARRFAVFPNEFFRETFVERRPDESVNDRNDRAIRRVAHWYRRHVVGPEVILLTDDRACKAKAIADGLVAFTAREFAERMRPQFPDCGERLAFREEDFEETAGGSAGSTPAATPRGEKRKGQPQDMERGSDGAVYPPHLKASEVERGLKEKRFFQGTLRMHMNTCLYASVAHGAEEVEIQGRLLLNRAVDGDTVVVEKLDGASAQAQAQRGDKRLRHEVADSEFGAGEGDASKAPSGTQALMESALELAKSFSDPEARPKGRVVGILRRNWREYCGSLKPLHDDRKENVTAFDKADRMFIPTDSRLPNIMIQTRHSGNLENKRIVVVLDGWDRFGHYPRGHWTQVLGEVGDRGTESAVILHEHGVITREFGDAILRCLPPADWQPGPEDLAGREDFRNLCLCSVDPPGCKDIDDAVSCERLPNGNFRVGVHIADVTHFVHPDTAIDKEAAERCTTVYLVERRTDMLPGLLTTDICSLRGGVDRLTFSVMWEIKPDAEIVDTKFCKAIIRSQAALSYAEAQAKIDDHSDRSKLTVGLRNLNKLAKLIRAARMTAGALELASQEVKFELDSETQDPTDVAEYTLRETNKMIEEFMLLANQAVATKILATFPMFGVLRRHPPPKDEALKTMGKLLAKHGISDFKYGSNKELGASLGRAVKPDDPYFNQLVRMMATRCMNQAVYFCTGEVQPELYFHFGLAMERYTHFTSPIRRYADVLVHRLLAASLGISPLPQQLQSKPVIAEQCEKINVKHRMAQWAGRASADLHTFMYFKNKGKQSAEAVVTRVRRSGMQVVVQRYGIDGVVPMPEEEWDIDEDQQTVTSKKDKKVKIEIFRRVIVNIEADATDFRNRTRLTFERCLGEQERLEAFEAMEEKRKQVVKEMFPDRLIPEAN